MRLVNALSKAIHGLSAILEESKVSTDDDNSNEEPFAKPTQQVLPQAFRDALACHLYMLFSVMNFVESEAKIGIKMTGGNRADNKAEADDNHAMRSECAVAMLVAAKSMSIHRSKLWKCGVPDETVVILPCRIAYQMLETATGVLARKTSSADAALGMIAATVDSADNLLSTIVAALVDLLHSYEHIAPLVAELCGMVSEIYTNKLAIDLLREIGRLDPSGGSSDGRANGVKYIAPLISHLACIRPRLVLSNISLLLPHLNAEPYQLRSAVVAAIGFVLVHIGEQSKLGNNDVEDNVEENPSRLNFAKSQNALFDILLERSHDISSFTRSAVLKTWISIVESESLPLDRILPVTALAIDRLNDKTVITRRSSMQVRFTSRNKDVPLDLTLTHELTTHYIVVDVFARKQSIPWLSRPITL
jgi:condensin complex subunit 1